MYYGKKKGIIIGIVVAVVVVLLAVLGVVLFTATDLFKSNKDLFWKYTASSVENVGLTSTTQLEDIEKLQLTSPYTMDSSLTLSSSNAELDSVLGRFDIKVEEQTDKTSQKSHVALILNIDSQKFLEFEYAQDGDVYALKSDDIVTAFLGIRNDNLKVFAQKLGITDTDQIPDKITPIDYSELKFTQEEIEHIKDRYSKVILDSIPDSNYSKEKGVTVEKDGVNYNTTSYRLDLSQPEISTVLVNLLTSLKEDSIILNSISTKLKTIGIDEQSASIASLSSVIDQMISSVRSAEIPDMSFVVYSDKKEVIASEIIVKNYLKATIYTKENNIKIVMEDLTSSNTVVIDTTYRLSANNSNTYSKITYNGVDLMSIELLNVGSAAERRLQSDLIAKIYVQNDDIEVKLSQSIEFVDQLPVEIVLDNTNCAVLNDYSLEDLSGLLQAVVARAQEVFTQKGQVLTQLFGSIDLSSLTDRRVETEDEVLEDLFPDVDEDAEEPSSLDAYNTIYSAYQGNKTAADIKSLIILVNYNSETDPDHNVKLTLNGVEISDDSQIDENASYTVDLVNDAAGHVSQINITTNANV